MKHKNHTILLTGAAGKVARSIATLLQRESASRIVMLSSQNVSASDSEKLQWYNVSVTDYSGIKEVIKKEQPDVIVNCAAMTDVDGCEREKKLAWDINVKAIENLVHLAHANETHLINFSTDYVFDGHKGPYVENDIANPINYYGKTKLAGENVCKSIPHHTIIRTNVVYGIAQGTKKDFVEWLLEKSKEGGTINIVHDQFGNPTFNEDLALGVLRVIEKKRFGTYNIAGSDYISRLDFAKAILRIFDCESKVQINPIDTVSLNQIAKRPLKAGLVTLKSETVLGIKPTSIESGLCTYKSLQQKYSINKKMK